MADLLTGMRVVESAAFVAAPLAGMTLAQMGAEVIRIDQPGGGLDHHRWPVTADGVSLFWAGLNKGKKSFCVDFRKSEGRELVTALICAPGEAAGLFLTNLKVKGWTDFATLSQRRPDVIVASVIGTRDGGPAVDYTVNPGCGFPNATGPVGSTEPVAHVLPAWDCITGQMAALGLMAAERRRRLTGQGGEIELALKDVASAMLGNLGVIGEVAINGVDRPKYGNALYGAFGKDFVCADGRRVMVIGLTARQWQAIVKATGSGEAMAALAARLGLDLSKEGARFEARDAIAEALAPWFAARSSAEAGAALEAAGATWSVFRSFAEAVAEDPDLSEANPMFATVAHPGIGPLLTPGSPFAATGAARLAPGQAPVLGGDTEAVLADTLGLSGVALGRLFDEGVVHGPHRAR
jgi:2-methylfumaryl-CoA isomerase